MHTSVKSILQSLHIYHPLQHFYRRMLAQPVKAFYRIRYAKYKGTGYTCNVCKSRYSRFVPHYPSKHNADAIIKNKVIAGYGENVFCPCCLSTNRERLVIAMLHEQLQTGNKKILHFSPEKNVYYYLKNKAQVTTVDIMPAFYTPIDPQIQYADATHLAFGDDTFDMVIANHIMEHIPNDTQAMREKYRVLKKGGAAVLQAPYSEILPGTIEDPFIQNPSRQEQLFGQKDHVRIYAFNDYVHRLQQSGFEVTIHPSQSLHRFARYAIQEGESFLLCCKKLTGPA